MRGTTSLCAAALLAVVTGTDARILHVATTGSDDSLGTATAPLRTIAKASTLVNAGDTVLIRAGEYYERRLSLDRGGQIGRPVVFRAAPGAPVVINHGLRVPAWSLDGGTVYRGMPVFPNSQNDLPARTTRVVVDGRALVAASSRQAMAEGTFWVDGTGQVFAWAFGGASPQGRTVYVINWNDSYKPGVFVNAQNVILDGLTLRAAETAIWAGSFACWGSNSITANQPGGLVIRNCDIGYAWQYALRLDSYRDVLIENCDVLQCGLTNWPRGSTGWPHAIIGWDAHDVRIINSRVHDNHGEGVGPFLWCTNWQVRGCTVYDNWSVNIYIDSDSGDMVVDGNFVYNTGAYGWGDRNNSDGIRVANELADLSQADANPTVYHVTITNNIVVTCGGGIRAFRYAPGNSFVLARSIIANNTIAGVPASYQPLWVRGDSVSIVNNLIVDCPAAPSYESQGTGVLTQRNLILTGTVARLTGGPVYTPASYQLQQQSPALDSAVAVPVLTRDFAGTTRPQGRAPDIGAYERSTTAQLRAIRTAATHSKVPNGPEYFLDGRARSGQTAPGARVGHPSNLTITAPRTRLHP